MCDKEQLDLMVVGGDWKDNHKKCVLVLSAGSL